MNRRGITSASILVAAAGLAAASHATAAILNWSSAVNGTASSAARWNPVQVPTAADDLVFNATAGAQAYTVTFDAVTPTSRTMVFNEDTLSLVMSSPHTTTSGITIGSVTGDNTTVSLTSGSWTSSVNSTTSFNIGNSSGSVGTLNVSGNSSDLILSAAGGRLRVGNLGTGTLNITSQGSVTIGEHLSVATGTGSVGTLTVSGALAVPPFGRSTLISNGTNFESTLGSSGNATVNISNGALADFAGDVEIARASTSSSTVTVAGSGGLFDATLDVATNLYIGANGSIGVAAGTGTLSVNNSGQVLVGNALHVGDDLDGGTGTLNINAGALVQATSVFDGLGGTINHTGGTLKINGGTYIGFPAPLSVSGLAANATTLRFSGNGDQTLNPVGGVSLKLGTGTGTGNLFVEAGYDLDAGNGDINLGDGNGSTGNATVTGTGSRLFANSVNSDIRVGFNGNGNLEVLDAGQCIFRNLLVPNPTAVGNGFVNISGAGSNITTQFLSVGQGSGGTGNVQVQVDATLVVTEVGASTNIRATGNLVIGGSDAQLLAAGTITVDAGGFLRVGGTVANAALVDISGTLRSNLNSSGVPLVDAPVVVRSGGTLEASFDDFRVGTSSSTSGVAFESGSIVTVGSGRTLTLLDQNNIDADARIILQGGTIIPPPGRFLFMDGNATDQLSGEGTIDGNIVLNDLGSLAPSGAGLVFTGTADLSNSIDIIGTAVRFANGSTIRDFGAGHTFNCKVTADAGSEWQPNIVSGNFNTQAFGPITMGDGSTSGVTVNGTIHMGTNGSLTFNDANGVFLGPLTDMNGGTLTSVNGLRVDAGEVLRGNGSINVTSSTGTGLFIPTGTIDPDGYNSTTDTYEGIGHFSVDGNFSLQTAGTYLCEIAGFNNEFQPLNDRISSNDRVFLSGSTLVISLINGYQASQCDTFTILSGASFSGQFATVIAPPNVVVVYNPTSVQVLVSGCLADMDDGSFTGTPDCGVTIDDLLYFLFVFEQGTLEADVDDGSFTGTRDDGVTIDDLLYYLFRFEQGC